MSNLHLSAGVFVTRIDLHPGSLVFFSENGFLAPVQNPRGNQATARHGNLWTLWTVDARLRPHLVCESISNVSPEGLECLSLTSSQGGNSPCLDVLLVALGRQQLSAVVSTAESSGVCFSAFG